MAKKLAVRPVVKGKQGAVKTTQLNGTKLITPPKGRGRKIPKPLMK